MTAVRIPGYVAGTRDIDPVHPHIGFMAKHLMESKVRRHFEKFQVQIVTRRGPAAVRGHHDRRGELGHHRQTDPRR